VEEVSHPFACRQEIVGVESVDGTLFGITEMAGVENAT
jgi:hypothetical protein